MGYKVFGSPKGSRIYGVRIACYKTAHQRHIALLVIGKDVAEKMGWQHKAFVELAIGDGKEAGWLRIKMNKLGGYSLYRPKKEVNALQLRLMRLADDHPHPMEAIEHKIKSGALYVRLPKWAKV